MEAKQCQMIVTDDYRIALKKSQIENDIQIPHDEITHTMRGDLNRCCLISLDKKFDTLENIWLNEYKPGINNEYNQGRIEGSTIPAQKTFNLRMSLTALDMIEPSENISFSYFDDNDNLCAFTLSVLKNCPSIWFASVTINTTAPADQRQLTVFVPKFTPLMMNDYPDFTNTIPIIEPFMTLDDPQLFKIELLNDYLAYSLNSNFIKYFLEKLFDKNGVIQKDEFNLLRESIKNKHSMFDFPDKKIEEVTHRCELNQIHAVLTKLQTITTNTILFDVLIQLTKEAITEYSEDKYYDIKNNPILHSLGINYIQSKSRELGEQLNADVLFPKDNYELQYSRLTILLGSCPESPLKTEAKLFQQKINDTYLNLNLFVGLKKEGLAKDLNILGTLLMNPSAENFKQYAARIQTNEKASNNRELGGHLISSSTILALGALAAGLTLTSTPITLPIIATVGFFGAGSAGAIMGYGSANQRIKYKSELLDVEKKLIVSNPKEWVLSKLTALLVQNKDGKKETGIQTIMSLFSKTKESNSLNSLCNTLAQMIFSLNKIDPETANTLRAIRELVQEAKPSPLIQEKEPFSLQMITDNVEWASHELEKMGKNIESSSDTATDKTKEEQIQCKKSADSLLDFNQKIIKPIEDLINRKTKNTKRDEILGNLFNSIKEITNEDELITHLDNAIFALFDNSKNSKIGSDLLELRNEFYSRDEFDSKKGHEPSINTPVM